MVGDLRGLLEDLIPMGPVGVGQLQQDRSEPRATVLPVRREVGTPVEDFSIGREKAGEGPTTLSGECLDRTLIPRVDIGPLVPVHLDADPVAVQELRDGGVLVRLVVHHVTPVTPHRAYVEHHRLLLGASPLERLGAPRIPVDRLVLGRAEVGRRDVGESGNHGASRGAPRCGLRRNAHAIRLNSSAAIGNASSSIAK